MLDDGDGDSDTDDAHLQSAANLRARLKDASEHESRMRSTISSARRFALDLERTGAQPARNPHFSHVLFHFPLSASSPSSSVVLMSELVGCSSNIGDANTAPLARVSPSLREQQRARTLSAGARKRDYHSQSNAVPAAVPAYSQLQQPAIIGGILLPLNSAFKPRSQSATSRPKAINSKVSDNSSNLVRRPPTHNAPPCLHRGVYSLARAGPSIMSAWQVSAWHIFCLSCFV